MVPLMNYSDVTYIVKRHERIAQLVAITTSDLIFDQVDSLDASDRSDGGFGSTAQHSYFQLLHQGTSDTVADIVHAKSSSSKLLNAQAEGQAKLLAGKIKYNNGPDATNGNIPVNFFALNAINAETLGSLIAFWEYRVFITASMLGINPFDQFGVNAGKKIAQKIGEEATEVILEIDGSKELLMNEFADLMFHMLVLLKSKDISFQSIEEVLLNRSKEKRH